MENICIDGIDLVKASAIAFEALLTAIFTGTFLIISFRWGQRQAREEQKQREEFGLIQDQIDTLQLVIKQITVCWSQMLFQQDSSIRVSPKIYPTAQQLWHELENAISLFPEDVNYDIHYQLTSLRDYMFAHLPDILGITGMFYNPSEEGYDLLNGYYHILNTNLRWIQLEVEKIIEEVRQT